MLDDRARAHVERELQQIERLLHDYRGLLNRSKTGDPGLIELTALAGVLHSFYNGVENIFQTIAKRIDGQAPEGSDWHWKLLRQMASNTDHSGQVVSQKTVGLLETYLGFRHFVRHAYSFRLDWTRMKDLVLNIGDTWAQFQQDIRRWLESETNDERERPESNPGA